MGIRPSAEVWRLRDDAELPGSIPKDRETWPQGAPKEWRAAPKEQGEAVREYKGARREQDVAL